MVNIKKPKIHIMKLNILNDGTYSVILKTYWIKIIQRHWKKVFIIRNSIIKKRMTNSIQRNFELRGNYGIGLNRIPTIYGLLKAYSKECHLSNYKMQ